MDTWKQGDTIILRGWRSAKGQGLTYPSGPVVASEDGNAGGWDVYDAIRIDPVHGKQEISFYGHSVSEIIPGPTVEESKS